MTTHSTTTTTHPTTTMPPMLTIADAKQLVADTSTHPILAQGKYGLSIQDIPTITISQARLANMFPAAEDSAHIWAMTQREIMRQAQAQSAANHFRVVAGAEVGLTFAQYCAVVSTLRQHFPAARLATYSIDDIWLFTSVYHLAVAHVFAQLQIAGMDALADDRDRDFADSHAPLLPDTAPVDDWATIATEAARRGIPSELVLHWRSPADNSHVIERAYHAQTIQATQPTFTGCLIVADHLASHATAATLDRLARVVAVTVPTMPVLVRR